MRTSRNMAWYPPEFVERIRLIKRLQEERFMPLRAIRELLEDDPRARARLVELEDRILERALNAAGGPACLGAPRSAAATTSRATCSTGSPRSGC